MRLIDADKLPKYTGYALSADEVAMAVESAPTVDPVKHGRWVDKYGDGDWHCTCCGAIVEKHEQDYKNWYFCYHCGAKMNMEVEE